MIAKSDIEFALSVQERSFKLLQWLGKAVGEGFIPIVQAHGMADAGSAAKDWLQRQWLSLPPACRPSEGEMEAVANFFGTYLETSFDFDESPKQRFVSDCGCYCSFCCRLMAPQLLRAKSLAPHDRKRAAKLRLRRLEELALESGLPFHEERARSILGIEKSRLATSISAYASAMLDRIKGFSDGPAVLALWRDFAWTRNGSPDRKFKLNAKLVLESELHLVAQLNTTA